MNMQTLKKLSAICIVLVVSGMTWACGGGKGGSCGDKDAKDTAVFTAQCQGEKKEGCDKKDSGEKKDGCKDNQSKACPKK